jgi:demethylmenaquinone methyltransferase/2-methoxy-6-polyprenyl-1,4-benzoquinol methylase
MFDHFKFIAPFYDRLMGPPDLRRLVDLLKLPAPGWLLDGGGGTGRVSLPLRRMVGNVVVSDISQNMLAKAGARALPAVRARAEQLPFGDGTFERILVVDALHHFTRQQAAIGDLVRVLAPGGRLLIEEFDLNRAAVKLIALAERTTLMRSRFFRPGEIRDLLTGYGLKVQIQADRRLTAWVIADKT